MRARERERATGFGRYFKDSVGIVNRGPRISSLAMYTLVHANSMRQERESKRGREREFRRWVVASAKKKGGSRARSRRLVRAVKVRPRPFPIFIFPSSSPSLSLSLSPSLFSFFLFLSWSILDRTLPPSRECLTAASSRERTNYRASLFSKKERK